MGNAALIRESLTKLGYKVYGGVNAPYIWLKVPEGSELVGVFRPAADKGQRGQHTRVWIRAGRRRVFAAHRICQARRRQKSNGTLLISLIWA